MTWCVVVDCHNNSFTKERKEVRFFGFPKDAALRKQWIHKIKRENLPKNPTVCEEHFEKSCFKRDLQVSKF